MSAAGQDFKKLHEDGNMVGKLTVTELTLGSAASEGLGLYRLACGLRGVLLSPLYALVSS